MDHILRFDFGYSWPWNYGHLVACGLFVALAVMTRRRGWPRSLLALAVALATWAMAGFAVTQLVIRMNLRVEMPTTAFLRDAAGPVELLDVGAGSGRASIALLRARPESRVTALDLYDGYFGIADNTPDRLFANAAIAGAPGSDRHHRRRHAGPAADGRFRLSRCSAPTSGRYSPRAAPAGSRRRSRRRPVAPPRYGTVRRRSSPAILLV